MTSTQCRALLARYAAGESLKVLAHAFGVAPSTVSNLAKRAGLPRRCVRGPRPQNSTLRSWWYRHRRAERECAAAWLESLSKGRWRPRKGK